MKKARLKINYHNQFGDFKKGLELILNTYGNYISKKLIFNKDFVENNPDIFEVFEEKTAEEIAGEFGFKIGDKCWDYKPIIYQQSRKCSYEGKIQSFYNLEFGGIGCILDNGKYYRLNEITNKVAIHCPTKEDFEFIKNKLNINERLHSEFHNKIHILINVRENERATVENKYWFIDKNYLILSVEEYCKAVEIKPIITTIDKITIYNPEQIVYVIIENNTKYIRAAASSYLAKHTTNKIFSTSEAAQQWLNSQILFWCEDFPDGSFPVKSCGNCGRINDIGRKNCHYGCSLSQEKWQGQLKGEHNLIKILNIYFGK